MLLTRSYDYDAPSLTSRRSHTGNVCTYDSTEIYRDDEEEEEEGEGGRKNVF